MTSRKPYRAQLTVRFGDIDHAGIVYYPRFIHFFHVAMEEFFSGVLDLDYWRFLEEHRLGLPTVHLEVDFRRPLRYRDDIEVEVLIDRVGQTSISWHYLVFRSGELEPAAEARIVTVNAQMDTLEKTPIPDWLRQQLESYRTDCTP